MEWFLRLGRVRKPEWKFRLAMAWKSVFSMKSPEAPGASGGWSVVFQFRRLAVENDVGIDGISEDQRDDDHRAHQDEGQ